MLQRTGRLFALTLVATALTGCAASLLNSSRAGLHWSGDVLEAGGACFRPVLGIVSTDVSLDPGKPENIDVSSMNAELQHIFLGIAGEYCSPVAK